MIISDIGTANDDTALLCHTNHPADMINDIGMHSGGQWYRPDHTEVTNGPAAEGFRRNRGSMVIRLFRDTATDPPVEGIYYCQIEDDTDTLQIVFVGLYANDGRGNVS